MLGTDSIYGLVSGHVSVAGWLERWKTISSGVWS